MSQVRICCLIPADEQASARRAINHRLDQVAGAVAAIKAARYVNDNKWAP